MENEQEEGRFIRGACRFCGQMKIVPWSLTQEEAEEKATEACDCDDAEWDRKLKERIRKAKEALNSVFGPGAADYGQKPVSERVMLFLQEAACLMAEGYVDNVQTDIPGTCRVKLADTGKGSIKIKRTETTVRSRES